MTIAILFTVSVIVTAAYARGLRPVLHSFGIV